MVPPPESEPICLLLDMPVKSSVAPATSANVIEAALAPRVPFPVTFTVPALIVSMPERVFTPVSTSVPLPSFVRPPAPEMTPPRVWLLFEPKRNVPLFAIF